MQPGQRSSVGTLPENISFDHSSTSTNAIIDSQMSWNSIPASAQNRLPDYRLLSSETSIQYMQHLSQNTEWGLGESGSSAVQGDQNERKTENAWVHHPQAAALPSEERPYGPSNYFSSDVVNVNSNANQTTNGSFVLQNSSPPLAQDLNMSSGFGDQEDASIDVDQLPSTCVAGEPSSGMQSADIPSSSLAGPSRHGECGADNSEDRTRYSLDGHRTSCKRKALELHVGQSSGAGGSNCFQNGERSLWNAQVSSSQIAASNTNMTPPTENGIAFNNGLERANSRLRLGPGVVPASPFSLTTSPGHAESSRRNVRMRINSLHEQGLIANNWLPTEADVRNASASSRRSSRSIMRDRFLDLNPSVAVESRNPGGHSYLLHAHSMHQNLLSRWSGSSGTRAGSSSNSAVSREWNTVPYEEPASVSRNIPRSTSENPMLAPANEIGSSLQNPINWNFVGGHNNLAGNVASSSQLGPSNGTSYPAPNWSRRGFPQYPRRLSEIARRSLSSSAGTEFGGSTNNVMQSSSITQEAALPTGPDNQRNRAPHPRSALLERHLDGASGIPYSLRTLAAAREGRNTVMSEIRRVLDLMRRGEGLRFEDVMILDHSVLFGMADIHDRHRDMRLDVDNMSYEELLALEERIGNVCTGLSEETISNHLKQHKYVDSKSDQETEPCCICREEYNGGDGIGTLSCGHNFHGDCIKQWLLLKNLCPVCKTTGLIP